jgi:hypothetical protein
MITYEQIEKTLERLLKASQQQDTILLAHDNAIGQLQKAVRKQSKRVDGGTTSTVSQVMPGHRPVLLCGDFDESDIDGGYTLAVSMLSDDELNAHRRLETLRMEFRTRVLKAEEKRRLKVAEKAKKEIKWEGGPTM